jgi:hypothetical protein
MSKVVTMVTKKPAGQGKSWGRRLRSLTAWLTHAMFVLATLLAFIKAESPDAASRVRHARRMPSPAAAPTPPAPESTPAPTLPSATITRNARLLDRLVAAYPDFLKGHEGNELIWRDGARMAFDDGKEKTLETRVESPDIEDGFEPPYPAGPMLEDPAVDFDPGRARNEAFFKKMYGDCRKGEVEKHLVSVDWLPKHGGKPIKITSVNGAADRLREVSDELDALPPDLVKYLQPIAGTYNCRTVSRSESASAHAYGIAIDLNAKFGHYWQWTKPDRTGRYAYRNSIPWEIAAIFEKHGFIWGGKWYHFDTLHFEYRPELLAAPEESAPQAGAQGAPPPMPEKQPRNLD